MLASQMGFARIESDVEKNGSICFIKLKLLMAFHGAFAKISWII